MSEGKNPTRQPISRQRIELGVACIVVVSFAAAFPLILHHACLGYVDIPNRPNAWGLRFWCDVKASDYFIALFTLVLAIATYFLQRETARLAKGAEDQSKKMRESIAEATRSAVAMERVADSMATNVESVKASVQTSREIADRQKLITELQGRAYLSVAFYGMVPQNSRAGHRFEPRVLLINNGHTPAYKVTFRTAADVLRHQLPNDFNFPLPDFLPDGSISVIGPGQNKILSAVVPKMYPDVEVEQLKMAVGQRIYMWGEVLYEDAFGIKRFVKFSQNYFWLSDGTTVMSSDTRHHNDAN